jgi:hypothetical protein
MTEKNESSRMRKESLLCLVERVQTRLGRTVGEPHALPRPRSCRPRPWYRCPLICENSTCFWLRLFAKMKTSVYANPSPALRLLVTYTF